jgi:hypothetical protein
MSTTLEIRTLFRAQQKKLGLDWVTGEQHQENPVHSSKDDSPEISLVGHLNLPEEELPQRHHRPVVLRIYLSRRDSQQAVGTG